MRSYLWLTITVSATIPAWAADVDKFEFHGKKHPTKVSGFTGHAVDLGGDGDYQALRSIVWGEKTDEPCGLYIATSHVNERGSVIDAYDMPTKSVLDPYVFGEFTIKELAYQDSYVENGTLQRASAIKLDCGGNLKEVSTIGNDQYVYKLKVCTTDKRNSADNKLKGIRVWSRALRYQDYKPGAEPILVDEPTPHEAIHKPHCDRWHEAVACGAGEIATGVRVHYNSGHRSLVGNERDTITGLELLCRQLRLKDTAELSDTPIAAPPLQNGAPARRP